MFAHADRRSTYKVPPTTFTNKLASQEARREKALEEQRRRRAQKFDSSRQLDAFAHLSLGASDDEGDGDIDEEPQVIRDGVANYASLAGTSDISDVLATSEPGDGSHMKKKRSKSRRRRAKKPSKWANKCMYAELLEMKEEPGVWDDHSSDTDDGLPSDIEKGWVAVAPVPMGKRCLAITHCQSTSGIIGISPNTTLRSRLLGKMLLPRFPSSLPPLTILDCILDVNWRTNGILHVLDVIKWKGQDIADCETPFRFWWRDTRLAELPQFAPPSTVFSFTGSPGAQQSDSQPSSYNFQYPTSFIPVPYHTDTSLPMLYSHIVPLARSTREILVGIPTSTRLRFLPSLESAMSIDPGIDQNGLTTVPVHVTPDGLLLYVSQASYEEGISPLSCWIPIGPVTIPGEQEADDRKQENSGPLDLFQRLVYHRLARIHSELHPDGMDM